MVDETRTPGSRTVRHAAQLVVREVLAGRLTMEAEPLQVTVTGSEPLSEAAALRILARRIIDELEPTLRECWQMGQRQDGTRSDALDFEQWYVGAARDRRGEESWYKPPTPWPSEGVEHTTHFFAPSAGPVIGQYGGTPMSIQEMAVKAGEDSQPIIAVHHSMLSTAQAVSMMMDTRPRYEPRQGDGIGLVRVALVEPLTVGVGDEGWYYLHRIVVSPLQGGHTNLRGWRKTSWRVKAEAVEHWSEVVRQQTAQVSQRFYLPAGAVVEYAWVEPEPAGNEADSADITDD